MLGADTAVRAVVLAADGVSFCAGGDLGWMKAQIEADRAGAWRRPAAGADVQGAERSAKAGDRPGSGQRFRGGVGLLCIADVAVAAGTAKFGLTETRLGLIPATISPYVVARIGEGQARPLFMSEGILDAQAAQAAGLLTHVVPRTISMRAVEAEILPYLQVAPGAVGQSKALARSLGHADQRRGHRGDDHASADVWETDEAREGISAFLEKRTPSWRVPV